MMVRCKIAEPSRETRVQSRENLMRTHAVRGGSEGFSQQLVRDYIRSVHESCRLDIGETSGMVHDP